MINSADIYLEDIGLNKRELRGIYTLSRRITPMRKICLVFLILICSTISYATDNFVQNGEFEELADGFPVGWTAFQAGEPGTSFDVISDQSIFYEGSVSIRLTNLQEGSLAGIRQDLELTPGPYELSCYVRTRKDKGTLFSFGTGRTMSGLKVAARDVWLHHKLIFEIEETVSVSIIIQSHAEVGLPIWVDNVGIKMVPVIFGESIHNAELDSWDNIRVQLPSIYVSSSPDRYPVLIVTHGLGGDRNWAFSRDFGPQANEGYVDLCEEKGWILASADLGSPSHWGNDSALSHQMNLIQHMIDSYKGDPNRVCIHGASMGGGTALLTCQNLANRAISVDGEVRTFLPAACAETYGWTNLTGIWDDGLFRDTIEGAYGANPAENPWIYYIHSSTEFPENLSLIPVYIEHEIHDHVVLPYHAESMRDAMVRFGLLPEFHLRDQGLSEGHNNLAHHPSEIVAFFDGKVAPGNPDDWSFSTYLEEWERFGYRVETTLDRQIVSLLKVNERGFTLLSPNPTVVCTAPRYTPLQNCLLTATDGSGNEMSETIQTDDEGRLLLSFEAGNWNANISQVTHVEETRGEFSVKPPNAFILSQSGTSGVDLRMEIKKETQTEIIIYDILGRPVRSLSSGAYTPGVYHLRWDGTDSCGKKVANGVYLLHVKAGNYTAAHKVKIIR